MSSKPEISPTATAKKALVVQKKNDAETSKRLILVLGMHRSGTSVASRGIHALGADLGDNLMKPVANNNEKGFWEDLDFNRMNERILAKAASGWHFLQPIKTDLFQGAEFAAERIEAAQLLVQKLKKASVFAIKDPRTAVLLPFWQCVISDLGIQPSYLITLRNPLETAESLRKRDGFDHQKSLVLWLKHAHAAIKETEEAKRIFVSYDRLMISPRKELERIADGLNLTMPSENSSEFKDYVSDYLDDKLREYGWIIDGFDLRKD